MSQPQCSDCGREFHTFQALHAHCRDRRDHAYCEECRRLFVHFNDLDQHLQAHDTYAYDSSDYGSEDNSVQEEESASCAACNIWFVNRQSLHQHLATSRVHHWCFECWRDFVSETALQQHSSSRVHMARDLPCPLCSKPFKIPSALALHIESGACHNHSRHQVTTAVQSLEIGPTISVSRRLEGTSFPSSNNTIVHYSATEKAFNGSAYECYFCYRTFHTLNSLNAHLRSPVHDADEFTCPKCSRRFKLISGLVQHIESEVCGVARFKEVEDYTTSFTSQCSRLLTY